MNMQQIMQQAQRMQKDIMNKKSELDAMTFTGKSEWVEVTFKGDKDIQSVNIINDNAFDKENKEILSDMILIAVKDALKQIDKETENKFIICIVRFIKIIFERTNICINFIN